MRSGKEHGGGIPQVSSGRLATTNRWIRTETEGVTSWLSELPADTSRRLRQPALASPAFSAHSLD